MNTDLHFSSARADWGTPPELFARLHEEFSFTLDVCAHADNAKLDRYLSPADKDGLPDKQASVLAVLQDMYRTQAATLAATGMGAAPRVAAKDWREKCATLGVVKDRRRFGEFKAKLVKKGTVREDQGFVYLVAQDAD